jgi:hypothetical protein
MNKARMGSAPVTNKIRSVRSSHAGPIEWSLSNMMARAPNKATQQIQPDMRINLGSVEEAPACISWRRVMKRENNSDIKTNSGRGMKPDGDMYQTNKTVAAIASAQTKRIRLRVFMKASWFS